MAKMQDLTEMGVDELEHGLADAKAELFNLRFQLVTGKLDNYARIGQLRRDVARYMTVLREREIAEAERSE
jgi:large subunit ribosomal protein L29